MKQAILDSWQENRTFSIINQTQIYDLRNEIIHNTEVLKSKRCHYHDASILVRGDIIIN